MRYFLGIFFIILTSACSNNSGSGSNDSPPSSSSSSSASSSSSGSLPKPQVLICEDRTTYDLALTSSGGSNLGEALTISDIRYFATPVQNTHLIAGTTGQRLDQARVLLGELEKAPGSVDDSILFSVLEAGLALSHIASDGTEEVYTLACSNPMNSESTCEGFSVNVEEQTVSFNEVSLNSTDSSVTLNGSFQWAYDAEVNSERPSCLPPSSREAMIGSWLTTIDYGEGIVDDLLYIMDSTHLYYYDYYGDTFTGVPGPECYELLGVYEIQGEKEGSPGSIIFSTNEGDSAIDTFTYHFRNFGEKRVLSFENYFPQTLVPVEQSIGDLEICNFAAP